MKSAYELALERLDDQGIDRPRSEALSDETRRKIAEARSKAEAQLAELEILHKGSLKRETDPLQANQAEEEYRRERERIEGRLDRTLATLRGG